MKKILCAFFIAALLHSGFSNIALAEAEDEFFADEELQQDDIEQNVNDMLQMLEELQNDEEMSKEWLFPKDEEGKTEGPDPLEQFVKPDDNLNPDSGPTEKNYIEKTDELVRFDPDSPDSHFKLGLEYWLSKNLDEAVLQFQEVVRLDPENAHAYWNLGLLYDEKNRGPEAIENIKKAEGIYSKYNYPSYAGEAKKRLQSYSEKYGNP